jgi:AcrR family transcriptional regulator
MSPRTADASIRMDLIESAARVIATEGATALTLRRVAKEVGTSTMAVYTHFGSMGELRREVRTEGFRRLRAHMGSVEITGDPVADLGMLGWAYYSSAVDSPNLYRAMFMDRPVDDQDHGTGLDTFDQLVTAVSRCLAAGRFTPAEPVDLARQLWALNHGLVTLQFARLLEPRAAVHTLTTGATNLFRAFGDDPRATGRSMSRARSRILDSLGSRPQ